MTEFVSYEECACMLHLSLCLEVTCNIQMYVCFEMFLPSKKTILYLRLQTIILKTKYYIYVKKTAVCKKTP
jgi:hypothetical protein